MADSATLYRLPRTAFAAYASAYYRDAGTPLARIGATDALDLGPAPGALVWPSHRPEIWARIKRHFRWYEAPARALGDAWPSGAPPGWQDGAVARAIAGKPMAHRGPVDGPQAGFWTPAPVARLAVEVEGPLPDAAATRDALRRIRAEIAAELDPIDPYHHRREELDRAIKRTAAAFERFDLLTAVQHACAAVDGFRGLARVPGPDTIGPMSHFRWTSLQDVAALTDEMLAVVDRWVEGEAARRMADLQAFYRRAAAAGAFVVIEPGD